MFTYASSRVIVRQAVSASTTARRGESPQLSSTRCHSRRSARNFATVKNWSASAVRRKPIMRRAASSPIPTASKARR